MKALLPLDHCEFRLERGYGHTVQFTEFPRSRLTLTRIFESEVQA